MKYYLSIINLEVWNMLEEDPLEGHVETVIATEEMKPENIVFITCMI